MTANANANANADANPTAGEHTIAMPLDSILRIMYRAYSASHYAANWIRVPDDTEAYESEMRQFAAWIREELGEGNDRFTFHYEVEDLPHLRYAWEIGQRAEAAGWERPRPAGIPNCCCRRYSECRPDGSGATTGLQSLGYRVQRDSFKCESDGSGVTAEYDFHVTYADTAHQDMVVVAWPLSCRAYRACGDKDRLVIFGHPSRAVGCLVGAGYRTQLPPYLFHYPQTASKEKELADLLAKAG